MDVTLQAQMMAERCEMYLGHLRGIVYLLNYQSQSIRPGVLPPEWATLMRQIAHLSESTEREVRHYQRNLAGFGTPEDTKEQGSARAA
jgi:hypothetical protein